MMIIKRINNLALEIQHNRSHYWLCIWKQFKNDSCGYIIAGFDYDEEYNSYELNSVGDRLNDITLDWFDFGVIVKYGYDLLSKYSLEDIYNRCEVKE